MSALVQTGLTLEEYFELDNASELRHEYYHGRVYAMAGGTLNHSGIIASLSGELYGALKGSNCMVLSSDMRVRVAVDGLYTYPDIAVVCGKPQFADLSTTTLVNPALLIEVLSPSTEAYDRGFKATQYRKLASLREYALVSQDEVHVEIFRRQSGGEWSMFEWTGRDATCHFASVERDIKLADVYERVVFDRVEREHPSPTE